MKLKVYKMAAIAVAGFLTLGANSFAQQSAGSGSSSSTPKAAQAPEAPEPPTASAYTVAPLTSLNGINGTYYTLAPMAAMPGFSGMAIGGIQDSAYRKKMEKLQQQMHDLQKEMSTLRSEEIKKYNAEVQKANKERMDKSFQVFSSDRFKSLARAPHFNFNFDKTEDLDKKVASGEYKMKSKAYSKSYNVDGNDKISIDNRYGKVTVNTWAKNEVKVDVEIKAYANEDDDAQKVLDQVKIEDGKDGNNINFNTKIDESGNRNWGTWTTNGKTTIRKTIINYVVYMPAKSALTISNTFGGIVLPELFGKLDIKNTYGGLTTKALTNPENQIVVRYGPADIERLTNGSLKVSYGSVNLQSADNLKADISSSAVKIGTISTSGTINVRYGDGIEIGNLGKNLKNLTVTSTYAPVKVASLTNDNADFDVTVRYGGFSYGNAATVTSKSPDDNDGKYHYSNTLNYKGKIGKGNSDKVITINTTYSSVKFDQ